MTSVHNWIFDKQIINKSSDTQKCSSPTQVLRSLVHDTKNLFSRKKRVEQESKFSAAVYQPYFFPNQKERW